MSTSKAPKPKISAAMRRRTTEAPAAPGPDMAAAYRQAEAEPVKATSIRLPERLHKQLRIKSAESGVPMSQLIIQAIEQAHPETKEA